MRTEKERKPERLIELEKDFALWRVPVELLREQDKNARIMDNKKFDRLTDNIKKDGRIESLPLCQLKTNKSGNEEFHIISGHHRTRAARKAGVLNLPCLVIERKMTRDEIISKQLSHNSLSGYDDQQLLKELYDEIDNIDLRISSGLADLEIQMDSPNVSVDDISIDLDYELINILFLPKQVEDMEKVMAVISEDSTKLYLGDKKHFDNFAKQAREISGMDNIKNMSAIFARMLELVKERLRDIKKEEAVIRDKDKIKDKKIKSK